MKEIRTEDAAGQILCHDITQIIKDEKKGVLFSKGHIVKEEDIPLLAFCWKKNIFLCGKRKKAFFMKMRALDILYVPCAGDSMHGTDVKEGKIELVADENGVLKIPQRCPSGSEFSGGDDDCFPPLWGLPGKKRATWLHQDHPLSAPKRKMDRA